MTLNELKERVDVSQTSYGNYEVTIIYRNKKYTCHSNDSMAFDAIIEPVWGSSKILYYTEKQAYQAFYDECKMKNGLN